MDISLIQGLGLAIIALIVGMDFYLENFFLFRPIIVATLTGLVLGNLETALIIGGMTELAFAGLVPAGGNAPPNPILAAIMGVVLAYTANVEAQTALGLALPFSFLMQYIVIFFWSSFALVMPSLDRCIEEGKYTKFKLIAFATLLLVGITYAGVVFLSAYAAQDFMRDMVSIIPTWLSHGFEILGGVLPAIGFAMLLRTLLKSWLLSYLIIGFVISTFAKFNNMLPLAAIGLAFALYEFFRTNEKSLVVNKGGEDGI